MRATLCPARLAALVVAVALAAVYTVGGWPEVVAFLIAGGALLVVWAWCAAGAEADRPHVWMGENR